jgi:hypothetical protein
VQIYLSEAAKAQFAKLIAQNKLTGGEFVKWRAALFKLRD